jgi:predicted transcriptional regulator
VKKEIDAAAVAAIVTAYLSNHQIAQSDLPGLISGVRKALTALVLAPPTITPCVPLAESVTPDRIICLEDGKPFKSIKRHLRAEHGLTPQQYREKWRLPADYPMVAPSYARKRSKLAKDMSLGRKPPGN